MNASKTALMVAAWRGRASARADALCDDAWAAALAGEDGQAIADAYERHNPHMELWLALRTRVLDQIVADTIHNQVVILGAGLDTRAHRLARPGLRFFEVDHPDSQADKRARIAQRAPALATTSALAYVPCDFERDDFVANLVAAGFEAAAPALFIWEGVVYYLTEAAVRATLAALAALAPASVVAFDYLGKRFVSGSHPDEAQRDQLADIGEPLRFGLNDPLELLATTGFRHVRTLSFDEACLSLTGTYVRARAFRFQGLAFASRASPMWPLP